MLNKTELTKLKALFGKDTDKIIEAIKADEEVDITLPTINNLSEEDLATRDENTTKEAKKAGFTEGKNAGIEIANKAISKKYGLTDVDTKDPDKVIAALDAKVATGDNGLKEQITLLQKDVTRLEGEKESIAGQTKQMKFETDLLTKFPKNRSNILTDEQYLSLIKNELGIEELDGKQVVKRKGEIMRDPVTKDPLPLDKVVESVFTESKWLGKVDKDGGRGGDDNPGSGGTTKTLSKTIEAWEAQGKNPMSQEFQAHVAQLAKTDGFDMNA
jgi:hypothetical protein